MRTIVLFLFSDNSMSMAAALCVLVVTGSGAALTFRAGEVEGGWLAGAFRLIISLLALLLGIVAIEWLVGRPGVLPF